MREEELEAQEEEAAEMEPPSQRGVWRLQAEEMETPGWGNADSRGRRPHGGGARGSGSGSAGRHHSAWRRAQTCFLRAALRTFSQEKLLTRDDALGPSPLNGVGPRGGPSEE